MFVGTGAGPGGLCRRYPQHPARAKKRHYEKQWWGGVCLNVGCIPSKALLRQCRVAHLVQHRMKEFGFTAEGGVSVDYGVGSSAAARHRPAGQRRRLLMKKNKIDTYDGWGTIQTPRR